MLTIKWETGNIHLENCNYFVTVNMESVKKLLKLAQKHNTEDDRLKLIDALKDEVNKRDSALQELCEMRDKHDRLVSPFIKKYVISKPTGAELAIARQNKKLEKVIGLLNEQKWWGV